MATRTAKTDTHTAVSVCLEDTLSSLQIPLLTAFSYDKGIPDKLSILLKNDMDEKKQSPFFDRPQMLSTLKENPRLIMFGMLTAFFSGPGQTFLVSLFTPDMINYFDLTQTSFGSLYSVATLSGAILLPWLGRLLDRTQLLAFALTMGFFLSIGCLTLSLATQLWAVVVGFTCIRAFGQGAMSLISSTTMARHFDHRRGKALSWAGLGHPLSSALFPLLVSFWITAHGWRNGWTFLALLILLMFFPSCFLLLRRQKADLRPRRTTKKEAKANSRALYRVLIRDPYFYLAVFAGTLPAFILTGLFLFQASFADWKGWSMQLLATAFIGFSLFRAATAFSLGPLIDRFSAHRLYRYFLIPLTFGVATLLWTDSTLGAFAYLGLCGITVGASMTIQPAYWAEQYGTKNIGSIKGLTGFFAIFSTAVSPPLLGVLLDQGVKYDHVLLFLLALLTAGVLASIAVSRSPFNKHKV